MTSFPLIREFTGVSCTIHWVLISALCSYPALADSKQLFHRLLECLPMCCSTEKQPLQAHRGKLVFQKFLLPHGIVSTHSRGSGGGEHSKTIAQRQEGTLFVLEIYCKTMSGLGHSLPPEAFFILYCSPCVNTMDQTHHMGIHPVL